MKTPSPILRLLVLASLTALVQAQEVSIPDPALNAAIRDNTKHEKERRKV
jgi:hypothetical protein